MSARVLVVTGTDTGVGKTLVTRALGAALSGRGRRVTAIKPVESGCDGGSDEDGRLLAAATSQDAPLAALTRLRTPVAPPVAADLEGEVLDPSPWMTEIRAHVATADVVLIEGAGGLLSPLTWDLTLLDVAVDLRAPMIVVTANRLGCLNHTLLTVAAIRARGLRVAAVVLSDVEIEGDGSCRGNAASLQRLLGDIPLFELPRAEGLDAARAFLSGLTTLLEKGA